MEDSLTLDELFLTFEKVMDREKRRIAAGGLGLGGDMSGSIDGGGPMKDVRSVAAEIAGKNPNLGSAQDGDSFTYSSGPIASGNQTLVGYRVKGQDID